MTKISSSALSSPVQRKVFWLMFFWCWALPLASTIWQLIMAHDYSDLYQNRGADWAGTYTVFEATLALKALEIIFFLLPVSAIILHFMKQKASSRSENMILTSFKYAAPVAIIQGVATWAFLTVFI